MTHGLGAVSVAASTDWQSLRPARPCVPSQDSTHGPAPLPPSPASPAPKLERSSEGDGLAPQGWQGPVSYRASRNLTKSLTVLLVKQEIGKELQLPCFSINSDFLGHMWDHPHVR